MNNIKWPKTMPILNGHDMFIGDYHSPCGRRHCLIGQAETLEVTFTVEGLVVDALTCAIRETGDPMKRGSIGNWNDDHRCAINAKIWNRAMYLLGYTEGNPQSKPVIIKKDSK